MSNSGHGGAFGLTPKAGAYLEALRGAYQRNFGEALPINSGGRTYAEQARLYALYKQGRGNLAAPPGTSTHESGRAVDFGGRAHYEGTPQQSWLVANSGKYGFSWTGKSFSQREAWHFDFVW
jgi:LAS superfamily LD-carboxypeptidase LdcB